MQLRLSEAARVLNGEYQGPDIGITALSTDSRQLQPGEFFIALKGPNFDAHDFLDRAAQQGAAAALVNHWVEHPLPQLRVNDTLQALGVLGSLWRRQFAGKVVALTGSNGKTTVKEMIAAILRTQGKVLATHGNLNNEIGVPLTLSRLSDEDFAVIEMGANHPGEIAYLTGLVRPDVALITNIGPAHLEGFGDLDGVARAKGEIFSGLADNGLAVINRDEIYADGWLTSLQKSQQVIDFALTRPVAAIQGEVLDVTAADFCLKTAEESIVIRLPLPGRHNIANALAAAAAATALGVPLQNIKQGLQGMNAVAGRLQMLPGPNGSRLINDTYNANPASLAAAFKVLAARPEHSWLVLGDMAELGENTSEFHDQAGKQARAENIERVYGIGQYARVTVEAFGEGGSCFKTMESLLQTLHADLQAVSADEAPVILVKGSRSMRMERVIQALSAAL